MGYSSRSSSRVVRHGGLTGLATGGPVEVMCGVWQEGPEGGLGRGPAGMGAPARGGGSGGGLNSRSGGSAGGPVGV